LLELGVLLQASSARSSELRSASVNPASARRGRRA
jgi:hypothetical protein